MPTYQYACTECGHNFEIVQSFTDAALTECRQCAGRLRKVFNSVGIVFKGSGFYRTDSREGAKAAKGDRADKGSTDTKPETAKESAKPKADSSGSSSGTGSSSTSTAGSAA